MRNIFILYMAPGNYEQMVHYEDTIRKRVAQDRLFKYLDSETIASLRQLFGNRPIPVWGSRNTRANRQKFDRMRNGDDVLIVKGDKILMLGKIAGKLVRPELSRELWKNLRGEITEGWDLIYFIGDPYEIDFSLRDFNKLIGYQPKFKPRGFMNVEKDKAKEFYDSYEDLYSVLLKIKQHKKPFAKRPVAKERQLTFPTLDEALVNVASSPEEISDHVKMQCKLLRLGLKTGAHVWVPKSDQKKMLNECERVEFPENLSAGIDTDITYVENIDVLWKGQFKIHAAFEIENSTSVYSGLLRFSDLKIVAPNHYYPLYLVAPISRRTVVEQQVNRPTFKELGFDTEVRYLSYEAINDVDEVIGTEASLPTVVELLNKKSELLAETQKKAI